MKFKSAFFKYNQHENWNLKPWNQSFFSEHWKPTKILQAKEQVLKKKLNI
jgi:hypothetical protein